MGAAPRPSIGGTLEGGADSLAAPDPSVARAIVAAVARSTTPLVTLGTPPEAVYDYLGDVDMILVMTVHPGFGGQGFMTEQLPVIEQIRARIEASGRDIPIEVDGGITPETIRLASTAGASLFVSGSFIFHSKNYQRAIAALKESLR